MTLSSKLKERLKIAFEWIPTSAQKILDLGSEMFDLGCLPGALVERKQEVHVVNVSLHAVTNLRASVPSGRTSFSVGDACNLPYKSSAFDIVIMTDVLEHVISDVDVVKELFRVMQPGGILIITVPCKGMWDWLDPENVKLDFRYLYTTMIRIFVLLTGKSLMPVTALSRHRHYSISQLQKLFKGGFELKEIERHGGPLYAMSNLLLNILEKLNILKTFQTTFKHLMLYDYNGKLGPLAHSLAVKAIRRGNWNDKKHSENIVKLFPLQRRTHELLRVVEEVGTK